jgi:hypothetical protein
MPRFSCQRPLPCPRSASGGILSPSKEPPRAPFDYISLHSREGASGPPTSTDRCGDNYALNPSETAATFLAAPALALVGKTSCRDVELHIEDFSSKLTDPSFYANIAHLFRRSQAMVGVRPSYNSAQVGLLGIVPAGLLALPTSLGANRIVTFITTTTLHWPAPSALRGGDPD